MAFPALRGTVVSTSAFIRRLTSGKAALQSPSPLTFIGNFSRRAFVAVARSSLTRTDLIGHGNDERIANLLLSNACCTQQRRFVARVKVHRFAGVIPLKVRSPKSEWYIQAEKEFLSEREQVYSLCWTRLWCTCGVVTPRESRSSRHLPILATARFCNQTGIGHIWGLFVSVLWGVACCFVADS